MAYTWGWQVSPDWLLLRRNLLKMPGSCETMWTMWTTMWKGARLCGTLWNYVKRCETHKPIEISWHRAHCKAQTECHHKTLRFFIASASVGAEATLRSSVARLSSGSGAKRWNIVSLSTEARFKSVAYQRVYEFYIMYLWAKHGWWLRKLSYRSDSLGLGTVDEK